MWRGRRRGWRRASLGGWLSDMLDVTHDYVDDWTDRLDDFEYDMRDAFDDVAEDRYWYENDYPERRPNRRYYGRPYPDEPYPGNRRPIPERPPQRSREDELKEVFDKAGLSKLAERVENLTKLVEQLTRDTLKETSGSKPK